MLTNRIIDLEQDTPQWHAFRKGKVGASLAPGIMGVSPWKTYLQTWEDMQYGSATPMNEAMERGKRLEEVAREWLNRKYNWKLKPAVVVHKHFPSWHYSSLDGLYQHTGGKWIAVEIKVPGVNDHEKAKLGYIPEKYIPQLNHQLEDIDEIDEILYFSWNSEGDNHEIWHKKDQEALDRQMEQERAFFSSVINYQPPEPTDMDWIEIFDCRASEKERRYLELGKGIADMEKEKETLKKELIAEYGQHRRVKVGKLKLQQIARKGSVDYSAIPELKGMDLNPYRKETIMYWDVR